MCADTLFVDEDCTFAQRGVVLVYIAVPPFLCVQWPRRAENCGNVSQLQFLVDVVGKQALEPHSGADCCFRAPRKHLQRTVDHVAA